LRKGPRWSGAIVLREIEVLMFGQETSKNKKAQPEERLNE
jgi:hypothetical protein